MKQLLQFVFVLAHLLAYQARLVMSANSLYLYQHNNADPIQEYTGPENQNDFAKSKNPRVVEFYSPHCPACIAFQPEYVKLARSTQQQYSSVEFYAVSCDAQPKICDDLAIDATPSMYLYPEGSSQGKKVEEGNEQYTVELLAQELGLGPPPAVISSRRMDDTPGFGGEDEDEDANGAAGADDDGNQADEGDEGDGDEAGEDGSGDSNAPAPGDEGELADGPEGNENEEEEKDDDDSNSNISGKDDDAAARQAIAEAAAEATTEAPDDGSGDKEVDPRSNGIGAVREGSMQRRDALPGPNWKPGPGGLPQLGGAAVQRPHDAGHSKARNQPKSLDRFKGDMKMRREEYQKKREGLGKFVRPDNRKDKTGNFKQRQDVQAMTTGMKASTPGTQEHQKREDVMRKRMQKAHKKMRIPAEVTAKTPLKKESLPYRKDVVKRGVVKKTAARIPVVGRRFRMTPEEELILDVSLSFVVGLETGVKYKNGNGLDERQKEALRNYLDLLNVSLPPEWGIHKLIDELRRRFGYIIQSTDNLQRVLSEHPLPRRTWSPSCVSRAKGTMGFSCGFWKLLHVTTVGVAEQRGGLSLVETGMVGPETKLFSPIDAADAIRDYMNLFFNCEPCRKNFVENYDNCENNRRCDRLTEDIDEAGIADWKELPVWLWEVHNEVSVRILQETKERSKRLGSGGMASQRSLVLEDIAAVWPNIETCFLCFHEDGTWDEAEVFKHLESMYWPDSDLDPKSERLIHFEEDDSFGLGVFLWIVMFGVLWVVYSTIGKTSPASFQQSLYQAKRMVTMGPGAGKKKRSN